MNTEKTKEHWEQLSAWKACLDEIATEVGSILPGKKARSCQHYVFQAMVMLMAHRAMLEAYLIDIGEDPAGYDTGENPPPF
jgi:hypothetical protein